MPDAPKRMSPERLEELRTLPEVSGLPYYRMQEGRELIADIDALQSELAGAIKALGGGVAAIADALADCKAVASECEAWRRAWDERDDRDAGYADPYHSHNKPGQWDEGRPCPSCRRFMAVQAARAATDANGALARHGGGA